MTVLIQLFAAFWEAFFNALLTHLPQVAAAWTKGNTTTLTDAPQPPPNITNAIEQEIANVGK